ncbi:50S ribosomal protein L10 [Candidatus Curtissbacteria bacterium RIFCSPHIGHO2_01_FULL_41_11]|uniref:Large ribosomal subunit protein uL10 n=1 Tax=Candidatus Curtissbacteria bacterium RIFCSPHIGHO2_01_FULL_41_11 TaxID=1797711 RepID=A0A1F5G545_9BACT|nr:MAG: 50S ribosomal protein L10 [Candidatus Curtissbacteria bacterium RIFCSPHIGHO2_01_FULL_41_11]
MKKKKTITAREIKEETVKSLGEKVAKSKTLVFANYHGLTVNQISDLRAKVKDAGGEILVTKNTLMKRALESTDYRLPTTAVDSRQSTADLLTGPTATIFAYDDEVAPVKVVAEVAKILGVPKFKFGFFGSDFMDMAGVEALSRIPSRNELQAKLVGGLSSPIYGFVSVLSANIRNLVSILDQLSKKGV